MKHNDRASFNPTLILIQISFQLKNWDGKKKYFSFLRFFFLFARKLNKSLIIFPPLLTFLASFSISRESFMKQQQRKKKAWKGKLTIQIRKIFNCLYATLSFMSVFLKLMFFAAHLLVNLFLLLPVMFRICVTFLFLLFYFILCVH